MATLEQQDAALVQLQEWLYAGATVYVVERGVSSDDRHRIALVLLMSAGPHDITRLVADVLGISRHEDGTLTVPKNDLTVYNLSAVLFRRGFICTGLQSCPSDEHPKDQSYAPHLHRDGGHALLRGVI